MAIDITGIANVVLVGITTWYAWSNHRLLKQVSRQAEAMERQSEIIAKQTELLGMGALATAYAALHAGTGPHNTTLEQLADKLWKKLS